MSNPKGVLAMIIVDGRVGAIAADFDHFTIYGNSDDKIQQAQSKRAMKAVGKELIKRYGGTFMSRLIEDEGAAQIAYDIFCGRRQGFEYREELIGYDSAE